MARPDAETMLRQIDAYADYFVHGESREWPEEHSDDFLEIVTCHHDDPEQALAYVVLGAARTDDAEFLGLLGCSLLENILIDPSPELLERIVAEARKSARFRWLLSNPFKVAVSEKAWEAIEQFRIAGPHEEPSSDTLPPRRVN